MSVLLALLLHLLRDGKERSADVGHHLPLQTPQIPLKQIVGHYQSQLFRDSHRAKTSLHISMVFSVVVLFVAIASTHFDRASSITKKFVPRSGPA